MNFRKYKDMPDNVPKIKVKKADGTFVEVPLDEFEKTTILKSSGQISNQVVELEDGDGEELSIEEIVGAPVMKPEGDLNKVPLITVRRPDGTYAKITLAQFELQKNTAAKVVDPNELKKAEDEIDRTPAVTADRRYSNVPKEEKPKAAAPAPTSPPNVAVNVVLNDQRGSGSQKVVDLGGNELKKLMEEMSARSSERATAAKYDEAESTGAVVKNENDQNVGVNLQVNKSQVQGSEPLVQRSEVVEGRTGVKGVSEEDVEKIAEAVLRKEKLVAAELQRKNEEEKLAQIKKEEAERLEAIAKKQVADQAAAKKLAEETARKEKMAAEAEIQRKAEEARLAKIKKEEAEKLAAKQQAEKEAAEKLELARREKIVAEAAETQRKTEEARLAKIKKEEAEKMEAAVKKLTPTHPYPAPAFAQLRPAQQAGNPTTPTSLPKGEFLRTDETVRPLASVGRESQIDEIMKGLSWKPAAQNTSRLRTIIQLFLKEIRGEEDTLELLQRREIDGGAGLSAEQAAELADKARKIISKPAETSAVPVLKNPLAKPMLEIESENDRLEHEVPMVVPGTGRHLSSTEERAGRGLTGNLPKPVVAPQSVVKVTPPVIKSPTQEKRDVVSKLIAAEGLKDPFELKPLQTTNISLPSSSLRPASAGTARRESTDANPPLPRPTTVEKEFKIKETVKPSMKDVTKGVAVEVGPVDEIRGFSLTDFRRLAEDPADAGPKLRQKFSTLRDESIVMYIEALSAWRMSPFYDEYIKLIAESLSKRSPLSKVCSDQEKIQIPELLVILALEKEIS